VPEIFNNKLGVQYEVTVLNYLVSAFCLHKSLTYDCMKDLKGEHCMTVNLDQFIIVLLQELLLKMSYMLRKSSNFHVIW